MEGRPGCADERNTDLEKRLGRLPNLRSQSSGTKGGKENGGNACEGVDGKALLHLLTSIRWPSECCSITCHDCLDLLPVRPFTDQ